jgi:hypothetical protein
MFEFAAFGVTLGHDVDETNEGLLLKIESPFKSRGVVTLKGVPELKIIKGFRRNPYGSEILPPKKRRLRTSNDALP